jgi:hypothetical protein
MPEFKYTPYLVVSKVDTPGGGNGLKPVSTVNHGVQVAPSGE